MSDSVQSAGPTEPDEGWPARKRLRLFEGMRVLAEAGGPLQRSVLRDRAAERVPLEAWDASTATKGGVRAWTYFDMTLSTVPVHAGWLHLAGGARRITAEGRRSLVDLPDPESHLAEGERLYAEWDECRHAALRPIDVNLDQDIAHGGPSFPHVRRLLDPLVEAWRAGGSVLAPGRRVWAEAPAARLAEHLQGRASTAGGELVGLDDDDARLLAAEAMLLALGPLSDLSPQAKRSRIREPLMGMAVDPPGLPPRLSGELEHRFVRAGAALLATPMVLVHSLALVVAAFARQPADTARVWSDPWALRDMLAHIPDVDRRVQALICLAVHPHAFTTVIAPADRAAVVEAFGEHLQQPSGDVERDLRAIVRSLQHETGHPVDLTAPPLSTRWSGAPEQTKAWLVRAQVDQRDWLPTWTKQDDGRVTLVAKRLRRLPAPLNSGALGAQVDADYDDLQVIKRDEKRRDVLNPYVGDPANDRATSVTIC